MEEPTPAEAKSLSQRTRRIPFGISALDSRFDGIPTGSSVLLAGAPDAGVDAYAYTSLAELMLARHRPDMHRRDVSNVREDIPESVTYVSLTNDREHVYHQLESVLDDYQFETLVEHLTVADFSQQFLDLVPAPEGLDELRRDPEPETEAETNTGTESIDSLLDDVSDLLADVGDDSVILLDSLTDLTRAKHFGLDRSDVVAFLMGLREAAVSWNGIVYVTYKRQAGQVRGDEDFADLTHGTLYFYSNDQGFETYRTMRVGSFGGALDTETQLVYETFVGPTGMRAKATQKIPPGQW
jgi:KaiC/GvpD/RAD55 family RecA-like ATPase